MCTLRPWNDSMPPDGRLELRLADLSHAELLRVAAIGCGESRAATAEANRYEAAAGMGSGPGAAVARPAAQAAQRLHRLEQRRRTEQ